MILAVRLVEGRKALRVVGAMVLFWLREKEASPSLNKWPSEEGRESE